MERPPHGSDLDRISDLPSNVIDQILGFLPLKDAVRSSSFSKKWKEKWHTLPNIIVDEDLFPERSQRKLEGIISYVLSRHEGKIEKFSARVEKVKDPHNLMLWIWKLSQKSVQDLTLIAQSGPYHELPAVLFSCQKLTNLNLSHWEVRLVHSFRGFRALVKLQLNKVNMETAAFEKLISSCPLLEHLTVKRLGYPDHLHINVVRLKYFSFDGEFKSMRFNTPILEVFSIKLYRIGSDNNQFDLRFKIRTLPASVKELYVRCQFQKYMAATCDWMREDPVYSQLRTLDLNSFCFEKLDQIMFLIWLVGSASNLTVLDINACCCSSNVVSEPLAKFWEEQNKAPIVLTRLQKVRVRSFHGKASEILFIQHVMANSPMLEEMTVESVKNPDFEEDEVKALLQLFRKALTELRYIGGDYDSSSDYMSDSDDNSNALYSSDDSD